MADRFLVFERVGTQPWAMVACTESQGLAIHEANSIAAKFTSPKIGPS